MADNRESQGNQQSGQGGNKSNRPAGLSWSQPQIPKVVSGAGGSSFSKPSSMPSSMTKTMPPRPGGNGARRSILLFIGGIVVGGLITWGWASLRSDTPTEGSQGAAVNETEETGTALPTLPTTSAPNDAGAPTSPAPTTGASSLVIPPTQPAGLSVAIESVVVSVPTWVVVYETANGVRGNALGAKLVFPTTKSETVNLLRATQAGQTYWVGRSVDNGDKKFSLTEDAPVVSAAGTPLYVEFRTQ